MEELVPILKQAERGRSFAQAKEAFAAAQCVQCHRMGKEGRAIGPDLTGVAGRFNRRDLLEHILYPSKIISDRYQTITFITHDDEEVTGTILDENDDRVLLIIPATQTQMELAKNNIMERQISTLSAMPEGLFNSLNQEEILDLLAYLEADGQKEATCFKPSP
jgi:putative heme-binding domain-containing protein